MIRLRAGAAPRPLWPLPSYLFEPRRAWLVVPTAVALSLTGALLLSGLATALSPGLEGPEFRVQGWALLFGVVLFAPVVETAIMAAVLEVLRRLVPPWCAVALSAVAWGIAHSTAAPMWGAVIWWPFMIFSALYLVWRERSIWAAYVIAASVHALQNAVPAIGMALS